MLVAYWIVAGLVSLVYLFVGSVKVIKSRPALVESGLSWAGSFPAWTVKGIGLLEVLGAIGLVLPPLAGIAPVLAPWAGVGLVAVQVGAAVTHVLRGEGKTLPMNIVLLLVAAGAAWMGFIVWS